MMRTIAGHICGIRVLSSSTPLGEFVRVFKQGDGRLAQSDMQLASPVLNWLLRGKRQA